MKRVCLHTSRKCNAVLIPTHYLRDPMVTQPFNQPRPKNKNKKTFTSKKINMNFTNVAQHAKLK